MPAAGRKPTGGCRAAVTVVTGFFGGVMSVTGLAGFCGAAAVAAAGMPAGSCAAVSVASRVGSGRWCG